jgi:hypothetical protein
MKKRYRIIAMGLIGCTVLGVHLYAYLLGREGQETLTILRTLSPSSIDRVPIVRDGGHGGEFSVRDRTTLASLCRILQDLESWSPNHPSFVSESRITVFMRNGTCHEFDVCRKDGDSTGYVYGVRRFGRATTYLFRAKSGAISGWLDSIGASSLSPE